jgi:lipoate-protein ligase A
MQLNPDLALFDRVFGETISPPSQSICQLEISKIIDPLIYSAQKYFKVTFDVQPLTDREWTEILLIHDSALPEMLTIAPDRSI